MLRVIHFYNLKEGADKERMQHIADHEYAEYAKQFGCIRRKTWRFLDARAGGQPAESPEYMTEALWPSLKQAEAFTHADRPEEVREWWDEMRAGIQIVKSVRYVDEGG
jgi:hypothetical protein